MNNHPKNNLLTNLPYRRVYGGHSTDEEIFDIYHLGNFLVEESFLSHHFKEKKEELYENLELVEIKANTVYKPHLHKKSAAVIYIIFGTGIFILKDKHIDYKPNQRIVIPMGILHGFITNTPTLFLSIQSPPIIDFNTNKIDIHYNEVNNKQG